MAKPDKTERFKVTEREAGTGRVVHEMQGDAPALSAASPSDGAKLEGFEGPVNPLAVDPHISATSVPATGGGVSAVEVLPTGCVASWSGIAEDRIDDCARAGARSLRGYFAEMTRSCLRSMQFRRHPDFRRSYEAHLSCRIEPRVLLPRD